jgi:NDP-sugar pyrophosphorylase family protein
VPVAGVTLVERVLASLAETGPSEVAIIVNEGSTAVRDYVSSRSWPFKLRWIVETTPSSMHSFLRVVEALAAGGQSGPFLISTVDTIAAPGAFAAFAVASQSLSGPGVPGIPGIDVALAVTEARAGDDHPLLVRLAPGSSRIAAIGAAAAGSPWVTAGYYSVRASVLREANEARQDGVSALRDFLGRLHERGFGLAGVPVTGGVDVDRPGDVGVAERFLKQVGAQTQTRVSS